MIYFLLNTEQSTKNWGRERWEGEWLVEGGKGFIKGK